MLRKDAREMGTLIHFLMESLCIENPRNPPRIVVIIVIGIKVNGSLQPISIADGNKTKNANNIPLITGLIFKSIVDIKNPITIHIVNAEIFASQVSFCIIIGITSITPAIKPQRIPILIFPIILSF